jgi:hypothetical protein
MKIEARLNAIEAVLKIKTEVSEDELNHREEPPGARLFLDMVEREGRMEDALNLAKQLFPCQGPPEKGTSQNL